MASDDVTIPTKARLATDEYKTDLFIMPLNRGGTSETLNMSTLTSSSDFGVRTCRQEFLVDGPPVTTAVPNPLWVINVYGVGPNGLVQTAASASQGEWRRYQAGVGAVFTEWEQSITTEDLQSRQIVSENPGAYIPEGGTLFVVDPEQMGTDFDAGLGDFTAVPAGDTRWTANVSNDGTSLDHRTDMFAWLLWNAADVVHDGEALISGQLAAATATVTQSATGVILRGSNAATGYWAGVAASPTNRVLRITRVDATSTTQVLASMPVTVADETDFFLRFRAEGTQLRAKFWLASAPEPSEWSLVATDAAYASGYAGVGKLASLRGRWHMLSVAKGDSKA